MKKTTLPLASRDARFVNSIIDGTVIVILSLSILFVYFLLGFSHELKDNELSQSSILAILLISFLTNFGYYIFMESRYQRTIGKFITRTKVVTEDGNKPTYAVISLRTLCRLIPFDNLSFLITPSGLHDSLSRTRVVKWYQ